MAKTKSNRTKGLSFEAEFAYILFEHGFWAHNLTQNAHGQPADIIAAKNLKSYLIDCKDCTNDYFSTTRIESNQIDAMMLWQERVKTDGLFAIQFDNRIYIATLKSLLAMSKQRLTEVDIQGISQTLEEWLLEVEDY